ncbi:MAG: hypothetical protein ABI871_07085 [Chthoniobacterales bacterium]
MDGRVSPRRSETAAHIRLKRLALVWAQAHGYSVCAAEVTLPRCPYRADLAAYRPAKQGIGMTAIFECKQARPDLHRDNCCTKLERERLHSITARRQILEKNLRVHYPNLRTADSLFPEWESPDFTALGHRSYTRVMREIGTISSRLHNGTKFERLSQYRCANLFFLVLPEKFFRESELPNGWGALVESEGALSLARKPIWQENAPEDRLSFLQRIGCCATRHSNHQLEISYEDINDVRERAGQSLG